MKCTDFELRLQSLFDERGTLDGDAELQAHALTCPECQSLVETYELLFDGVQACAAERQAFAVNCVERAASAPESTGPRAASRTGRALPWVAAAAVLLAVGLTTRNLQQPVADRGEENQLAPSDVMVAPREIAVGPLAQPVSLEAPVAKPVTLPEVPQLVTIAAEPETQPNIDVPPADPTLELEESEAIGLSFLESPADEYAGLYRATGRSLAVMLRSMRPSHVDSALVEPVHEDPAGRSWRKLHSSIEPLTDSMTEALEGLLRGKPATPPAATADRAS